MYDIVGVGTPLIDVLVQVDDQKVREFGLDKGKHNLFEYSKAKKTIAEFPAAKISPGDSTTNIIVSASRIGAETGFIGKRGDDKFGRMFEDSLVDNGVETRIVLSDINTGIACTFITPDAERTFATFLGAGVTLNKDDVQSREIQLLLEEAKIFLFTGYQLLSPDVEKTVDHISDHYKFKIAFDLADPNVVKQNKKTTEKMWKKADIVFANTEEAKALFGGGTNEELLRKLKGNAEYAFLKIGKEGSLFIDKEDNIHRIEGFKAEAVDTTGAGDMFAGIMLAAIAKEKDLDRWGKAASFLAARVVEQKGARMEQSFSKLLAEAGIEL